MKFVFSGLILFSVFVGFFTGRMNEVSNAAIASCSKAVEIILALVGSIALWGGLMRVAEKSGLTDKIAKLFSPILRLLFRGLNPAGKAFRAISMNLTANLLGLGNAATPLGILAVKRIAEEEHSGSTATRNMVLFVVLNTASIQLIPSTIAALRLQYGATEPLDILPAILLSSLCSVLIGILMVFALHRPFHKRLEGGSA